MPADLFKDVFYSILKRAVTKTLDQINIWYLVFYYNGGVMVFEVLS